MHDYNIILADPPWSYRVWNKPDAGRTAASHYNTMSIADIRALPVGRLAAKDCTLFLWVTFPTLREALTVFWGLGHWTRANAEICLLATRGHPKRVSPAIHQVIISPVEEHSKKPDEVRERIVQLMGDLPRIELFARQSTPGWDVWGDEVSPTVDIMKE